MTAVLKREPILREFLLDQARRLFAERGFHAVSLRELGQAVGLHAGSLYAHIESKDALLLELIEEGFENLIDGMQLQLAVAPTLQTFLRQHLVFRQANPHWYLLALTEARHLSAPAQQELLALKGDYASLLQRLLMRLAPGTTQLLAAKVARQILYLLNTPPGSDSDALSDCLGDLEHLILRRLQL